MAPIIQAENLRKIYIVGKVEVPALREVSFSVEPGEFVSVIGPSVSGKSTLFYILGGLTPPTSGRVMIDGTDMGRLSDAQRTRLRVVRVRCAALHAPYIKTRRVCRACGGRR